MGKMRQTRRAMTFAGHSVGHVTGKVEIMKCKNCDHTVPVGTVKEIGVVSQCKIQGEIPKAEGS